MPFAWLADFLFQIKRSMILLENLKNGKIFLLAIGIYLLALFSLDK